MNFERNISPKKALNIGLRKKAIRILSFVQQIQRIGEPVFTLKYVGTGLHEILDNFSRGVVPDLGVFKKDDIRQWQQAFNIEGSDGEERIGIIEDMKGKILLYEETFYAIPES
jgi:hypothetical protein